MYLIDGIIEQIKELSFFIFDEKVKVAFFEKERRLIGGLDWQAIMTPAMAYDPEEDIFLLEEENLEYVFSNLPAHFEGRRIILSMVAHEMRHRVQYLIPETVLWTEEDSLLKERKDIQEKVKRYKRYLQQYYPKKAYSIELDARIISYLVARESHESLEHIADLIRYGPLVFHSFPDWLYFL